MAERSGGSRQQVQYRVSLTDNAFLIDPSNYPDWLRSMLPSESDDRRAPDMHRILLMGLRMYQDISAGIEEQQRQMWDNVIQALQGLTERVDQISTVLESGIRPSPADQLLGPRPRLDRAPRAPREPDAALPAGITLDNIRTWMREANSAWAQGNPGRVDALEEAVRQYVAQCEETNNGEATSRPIDDIIGRARRLMGELSEMDKEAMGMEPGDDGPPINEVDDE